MANFENIMIEKGMYQAKGGMKTTPAPSLRDLTRFRASSSALTSG